MLLQSVGANMGPGLCWGLGAGVQTGRSGSELSGSRLFVEGAFAQNHLSKAAFLLPALVDNSSLLSQGSSRS